MKDKIKDALLDTLEAYRANVKATDDDLAETWEALKEEAHNLAKILDAHLTMNGQADGSDGIFHEYYKITDKLQAAELRSSVAKKKGKGETFQLTEREQCYILQSTDGDIESLEEYIPHDDEDSATQAEDIAFLKNLAAKVRG